MYRTLTVANIYNRFSLKKKSQDSTVEKQFSKFCSRRLKLTVITTNYINFVINIEIYIKKTKQKTLILNREKTLSSYKYLLLQSCL